MKPEIKELIQGIRETRKRAARLGWPIQALEELAKEIDRLSQENAELKKALEPDQFWDEENLETPCRDTLDEVLTDVLDNCYSGTLPGEKITVRVMRSASLPDIEVDTWYDENGDLKYEVVSEQAGSE